MRMQKELNKGWNLVPWMGLECSWISQWAVPLTTSHTMIFPEASPEARRRQYGELRLW